MPKYSDATKDGIDSALEVGKQAMASGRTRVLFWKSLWERLNFDEKGRVSIRPILIAERRRVVMEMFDGTNAKDVAKSLGFSLKTIERDIAEYYTSHASPDAPKPAEKPTDT